MPSRKHEHHGISVLEAIETLSDIADLDLEQEKNIEIPMPDLEASPKTQTERTIEWLHETNQDDQVHTIQRLFNVILNYLKTNYQREASYVTDKKTTEGIKSIMVVVGEAAKKFDRFLEIREGTSETKITELKEYKQLQKFYLTQMKKEVDQKVLSKWILGLTKMAILPKKPIKAVSHKDLVTNHIFIDLDTVKKDSEYELLLLRKEDGSRFFNPRLLRNIKLICDFGENLAEDKHGDPLFKMVEWQDRIAQASARTLLDSIPQFVDRYFEHGAKRKDKTLVASLKKSLMALMLAANSKHLLENHPKKCCWNYFTDFQYYLRQALLTPDYQKWIAYTPRLQNKYAHSLLDLGHAMCQALFQNLCGIQELLFQVDDLIHQAQEEMVKKKGKKKPMKAISDRLAYKFEAMEALLKHHSKGPLIKVIGLLEESGRPVFDSLAQKNLPNHWFTLYPEGERMVHLRIPSPTHQRAIHEAFISSEFKGFLHGYGRKGNKKCHMLFNLQDRTSWKEHARAVVIEKLQDAGSYKDHLEVVTLGIDTDFYHQFNDYCEPSNVDDFIGQFYEHLSGDASGYQFPEKIRKQLFPVFSQKALRCVQKCFFQGKKSLSTGDKRNFISIMHLLILLKCLDIRCPDSFSFTCKDGVDTGSVCSGFLFVFLKLLNRKNLSEPENEYLNLILFGPALSVRERLVLPGEFYRMVEALRVVEGVQKEAIVDQFKDLFDRPILTSRIGMPSFGQDN